MSKPEYIAVKLEDDTQIYIETSSESGAGGASDASLGSLKLDDLSKAVGGIAKSLSGALKAAKPDKAQVEFNVEAKVESGALTALLISGSGKTNIKITLVWDSIGD